MRKIFYIGLFVAAVTLAACTDTERATFTAYGDPARVTCFSGGERIFDDFSTGKIEQDMNGSDGFALVSKATNRLIFVSGDCVVDYGAKRDASFEAIRP